MNISNFFIERPIFAGVISAFITIAGLIALFKLPISEYPEVVAALGRRARLLSGRESQGHR